MTDVEDLYPSRVRPKPEILPRVDPVVYGEADAEAPLSTDDIQFYDKNGYLFFDSFFSPAEVTAMQAEMNTLRQDKAIRGEDWSITEPGSGDLRSIFKIHELSPVFRHLARDDRLLRIAEFLLGSEVYIHQSRLNYKPGFRGREFYWHSDFETWHVEDGMPRMRALSMSIALLENNEHNGPLMVIPGSHRRYVTCVGETPDEHYKQSLKKQEYGVPDDTSLRRLVDEGGVAAPKGPAGSLIIFDCNTMHGSNGNITPYPRSNLFVVYNSVHNRLVEPFGGMKPRPEFIATREGAVALPLSETAAA